MFMPKIYIYVPNGTESEEQLYTNLSPLSYARVETLGGIFY